MCCGAIRRERWIFCKGGDFNVLLCVCIWSHVGVCMCQHPFLMSASLCVPSSSVQGSLISQYLSRDRHCFPFPGDTVLL